MTQSFGSGGRQHRRRSRQEGLLRAGPAVPACVLGDRAAGGPASGQAGTVERGLSGVRRASESTALVTEGEGYVGGSAQEDGCGN